MDSEERAFDEALAAWKRAAVPSSNGDLSDLSDRITRAAVGDFRFRRRVKWAVRGAGGSLCLFAVAFALWFHGKANDARDQARPTGPIINPVEKSNDIMTSFARAITPETVEIPRLETPNVVAELAPTPFLDPDRYIAIPTAARTSIEPVTEPASRAVNRLVKDLGSAFAIPKPKM